MHKSQIAIIDFGSQYTHLITRRIRQLGILALIYPPDVTAQELKGVRGIILSGGPRSVHDDTAIAYDHTLFDLGVPVLGLCYGHQLIAQHFGGTVKPGKTKEYGFAKLQFTAHNSLLTGIQNNGRVWMSHGDSVARVPKGFIVVGTTVDCSVAAMADEQRGLYGLQFHPEVAHTKDGVAMLKNFVFTICSCKKDWSLEQYWQEMVVSIKKTVGTRKVFLLVSGGVDSTVAFAVLEQVLGKKRVLGLHIDNGFMRKGESKNVAQQLAKAGFDNLNVVDASTKFLAAVEGATDPEVKRKRIGKTFLEVKDDMMKKYKLKSSDWVLGQGTIYPDTIEAGGTKHADTIKTHHNRVDEILKLMKAGAVVEPLVDLYKDEVRQIAQKLKLPAALINRHPFPGPGLGIRVLCNDEKSKSSWHHAQLAKVVGKGLQSCVLPIKSVGVQGDNRTYRNPALIGGTVSWDVLHDLSVRITNQISDVNRVVYLVAPKKVKLPSFKTKTGTLVRERLALLREVDAIVHRFIRSHHLYQDIWQFPVVLAPLTLTGGETVILRPVESQEAMTVNFYPMKPTLLSGLARKILAVPGIDAVLYDVTNKPPGTIEWE